MRSRLFTKATALFLLVQTGITAASTAVAAEPSAPIRLSRYTTVGDGIAPQQADPLAAVITVGFPRPEVRTVGEAIAYLLPRTGFRLDVDSDAAVLILGQPLPESQRALGPCTAATALRILAGPAFRLEVSQATRR